MPTPKRLPKALVEWVDCKRCPLHRFRRNVVFGRGHMPADILFIGEAPGKTEDMLGQSFMGVAGRILNLGIVDALKLSRRESNPPTYYITNVVACIPKDTALGQFREPSRDEELACWPRLEETWKVVNPRHIVFLGNVARDACKARMPDAHHLVHPAHVRRRGGTNSAEYRQFVRRLSEIFTMTDRPESLEPTDVFGQTIMRKRKSHGKENIRKIKNSR